MRKRLSVAGAALLTVLAAVFAFVEPAHAAAGFSVANGRLYDAGGTEFVMRGVNHAHTWYPQQTSSFANVKALGANAAYTARNVDYNGRLGAGASTSFGFIAGWNGSNPAPAVTCTAS
ncbi:cellulose binding domain-containing protein [Micromonospora purpureochromogenes]|uniref:CBM2 domain-containing protein n=1 Tax=Micromonospora purpureochromogenes TaxID=47872 RepID=A0ABX2RP63_9ACTN|nr:cellulose binding domain-containing protein [Micromonospora purpureochromogenes]NYF57833.1 hypothetical protein [Micromonospora purpureochromogenes]